MPKAEIPSNFGEMNPNSLLFESHIPYKVVETPILAEYQYSQNNPFHIYQRMCCQGDSFLGSIF